MNTLTFEPGPIDADDVRGRQDEALTDAEDDFRQVARSLFDQRDLIDAHIRTFEALGLDTSTLTHARNALEQIGAVFDVATVKTLKLASRAFQDAEGDFSRVLHEITKH